MKVVLVGPGTLENREVPVFEAVRSLLDVMGKGDTLVHTGGDGVGDKVDRIARRAKGSERRRLPAIDVQLPEIGRYERSEAFVHNAAQLVHFHMPDVVVYLGDETLPETKAVLSLALRERPDGSRLYPRVRVQTVDEFVSDRSRR